MLSTAMPPDHVTELIGARYRPLRVLGRGSIGEALLVADTVAGDAERALKWIPLPPPTATARSGGAATDPVLAALAGEFQILATLDHPHLTRVFDFGHDAVRGGWYLVEECSSGTPLAAATAPSPARPDLVPTALTRLAAQLLETLAFLHERGIVHGDIQPANVLVEDRDGASHLRLIDFSGALARWLPSRAATGTPGFIAPEILAGGSPSPATDLYSAGALLTSVLPATGSPGAALTDLCAGLCQLDPTLRLRSARDAARILGADDAPTIHATNVAQAPLFGRADELAEATTHLALASDATTPLGAARLVVTDGPVGIGKSRFLEELETRARLAGLPVVRLRSAAGHESFSSGGALHVLDPLPHPVSPLGRAVRARLAENGSGATPVRLAGAPASEDDARAWRSSLTEELSSRSTLWIDLGPLDEPACEALAAWVTPAADSATARSSLARRSGGNPLLLLELANARAAGHDLPERGRGVTALTDRIRALATDDRACLAALAILDDPASATELGFILERTPTDLHVRLRQLEGHGLVHASGRDGGRWLPTHGLAAEAALATAPESDRATWYRRAAEARESGCLSADPLALARDWLRAREPRRAVARLHDGWQPLARDGRLHLTAPLWSRRSMRSRRARSRPPSGCSWRVRSSSSASRRRRSSARAAPSAPPTPRASPRSPARPRWRWSARPRCAPWGACRTRSRRSSGCPGRAPPSPRSSRCGCASRPSPDARSMPSPRPTRARAILRPRPPSPCRSATPTWRSAGTTRRALRSGARSKRSTRRRRRRRARSRRAGSA
ncbi:MAG: protein kinase [Deltaproteobacteria bacterium]|nr:protein kinase [Deltaproteobacteria bacterium]